MTSTAKPVSWTRLPLGRLASLMPAVVRVGWARHWLDSGTRWLGSMSIRQLIALEHGVAGVGVSPSPRPGSLARSAFRCH